MRKTTLTMSSAVALTAGALTLTPAQAEQGYVPTVSFCDRGFEAIDANNDGRVTVEEVRAVRERNFEKMDADGDGVVTRAEFTECLQGSESTQAAMAEDRDSMDRIDADADGTLTADEFMEAADAAHRQIWTPEQAGIEDGDAQRAAEAGQQQGTEGDGQQTAQTGQQQDTEGLEQATPLAGTGQPAGDGAQQQQRDRMQQAAGADDGPVLILRRVLFIPRDVQMDLRQMRSDEAQARAAEMYRRLDTNRDMRISAEEWQQRAPQPTSMEERLDAAFGEADTDQDDRLTREEFIAAGERRMSAAQEKFRERAAEMQQTSAGEDDDSPADPPVVYYYYPHPM